MVSVINDPDQRADLVTLLTTLYDRLSLSQIIEYFYSQKNSLDIQNHFTSLDPQTILLIQETLNNSRVGKSQTLDVDDGRTDSYISSDELYKSLEKELTEEFYQEDFRINAKVFEHIISPHFKNKLDSLYSNIERYMFSQKNQNFSTFYSMVHSFTMVTQRAENVRTLIQQNKNTLKSANNLLNSNVLEIQRKIKTRRKLKK